MTGEAAARNTPTMPSTAMAEGSEAREAAERDQLITTEVADTEASERLFGINTESSGLIAAAVAASLLLVVLLLLAQGLALTSVAALTVGFTVTAAALDLREATHQHTAANEGMMAAAMAIAILHIGAGVAATACLSRSRTHTRTTATEVR